jgi:hypothetical protein
MSASDESAHAAALAMRTVVPLGGDLASSGPPEAPGNMTGRDRCVVCTVVHVHRDLQQSMQGCRTTSTRPGKARMPAPEAPIQLSLFPAPARPPVLRAPLFHVRCPECRAVNDVPSLPTICYTCRRPLGREPS